MFPNRASWSVVVSLILALCAALAYVSLSTASPTATVSSAATEVPDAGASGTLTPTVYIPLVINNCCSYLLDDFSDPISGWTIATKDYGTYEYVDGIYRITNYTVPMQSLMASSPDWMVLDEATVSVEAWMPAGRDTDTYSPGLTLIFGLDLLEDHGDLIWQRWYDFSIYPAHQWWALRKWEGDGTKFALDVDTSTAIIPDLAAHQQLKVQRHGSTFTLFINGTEITTITDTTSPLIGYASVGVGASSFLTAEFDNFEIWASGHITTTGTATIAGR